MSDIVQKLWGFCQTLLHGGIEWITKARREMNFRVLYLRFIKPVRRLPFILILPVLMGCQSIHPEAYQLKTPEHAAASSDLIRALSAVGLQMLPITYQLSNHHTEDFETTYYDSALLAALQPSGFSLRPEHYKWTLKHEASLRWKSDFWTDFVPLELVLATKGLAMNDLLLLPSQGEVYRAQVVGCFGQKWSADTTYLEMKLALRLEKRKRRGEFFPDHSDYNSKPLMDVFFRIIRDTLLEEDRVNKNKLDTDRNSENLTPKNK